MRNTKGSSNDDPRSMGEEAKSIGKNGSNRGKQGGHKSGRGRGESGAGQERTPSAGSALSAARGDLGNLFFSYPAGMPISLGRTGFAGNMKAKMYTPGFSILWMAPTIGFQDAPASAVNVGNQLLTADMRRVNSGSRPYDSLSVGMYCLSVAQCDSALVWLQTIYGIVNKLYTSRNRYYPKALLEAMGIDYESIKQNLADFRGGINQLITKIETLYVPNNMDIFNRWADNYRNIYIEGTAIEDQTYLRQPTYFYKYIVPADGSQLPYLDGAPNPAWQFVHGEPNMQPATYQVLLNYVEGLVDAIFYEGDISLIAGDIAKTYPDKLITLTPLPEDYAVTPVFSIKDLEMFANATVLCEDDDFTVQAQIVQTVPDGPTSPYLSCANLFTRSVPSAFSSWTSGNKQVVASHLALILDENKFLVTSTDKTDVDLVYDNSRYILGFENVKVFQGDSGYNWHVSANIISSCDVVVRQFYYTWYYPDNSETPAMYAASAAFAPCYIGATGTVAAALQYHAVRDAFEFPSPVHSVLYTLTDTDSVNSVDCWLDQTFGNFVLLERAKLKQLHEVDLVTMLKPL